MKTYPIPEFLKKKLPLITATLVIIFFGFLIRQELNFEYAVSKTNTKQQLQIVSANVEKIFTSSAMNINGLRAYFEQNPNYDEPALTDYVNRLFSNNNRIIKTVALTENSTIKYAYPPQGNEAILNVDLLDIPSQKDKTAKVLETGTSTLLGPVEVIQGWEAFIFISGLHFKANTSDKPDGLLTITLDHKAIFAESGLEQLLLKYQIRLINIDRDFSERVIYQSVQFNDQDTVSIEIYPYDQHWRLMVYPIGGWQIRTDILFAMILIGIITTLSAYVILLKLIRNNERLDALVNERTRDLIFTNEELQTSLAINEERQAELELLNNNLENTIVELKYTEQKLRTVEKMNVISELIAGIAHRVNTPIGTIQTMASYMKKLLNDYYALIKRSNDTIEESDIIANLDESLVIIERSTNKAIGIISSFKLLSSVQKDSAVESFQLEAAIDSIIFEVISQKNLKAHTSVNCDCLLSTNRTILSQALSSILIFISEYNHQDDEITYAFRSEIINDLCVLTLTISPVTLPSDTVLKPFEPHLLISADSKVTGLELFIAYQLITEVLSGDLRHTNTDTAHIFTFYLPSVSDCV